MEVINDYSVHYHEQRQGECSRWSSEKVAATSEKDAVIRFNLTMGGTFAEKGGRYRQRTAFLADIIK